MPPQTFTPTPVLAAPASGRRHAILLTAGVLLAAGLAATLANVLGSHFRLRRDATAMGEQTLAPRTQLVLGRLDRPYRVVIAADLKTLDPRARQHLVDVLSSFHQESGKFDHTFIDTGSAAGLTAYKTLVGDLVRREEESLRGQTAAVELAAGSCQSVATYLVETLSPALATAHDAIAPAAGGADSARQLLDQGGAGARLAAKDLADAVGKSADALRYRLDDLPVPATDRAGQALSDALAQGVELLNVLSRELRRIQGSEAAQGPAGDAIRALLPGLDQKRDQALIVLESLGRLKRPDILRVTGALQRGSTALVIGPPERGLTAIDLDALAPSALLLDAGMARADVRRRGEELLATALASLENPIRPIVVIAHAEPGEFFERTPIVREAQARLRLRGIDLVEWPVLTMTSPPRLGTLDPDRKRPIVYANIAPDASAGTGKNGLTGAQRAAKLGEILSGLAGSGANLLVSLNPSVLPTYGDSDPVAAPLLRFGLAADTGRPLLSERTTTRGRVVDTDSMIQAGDRDGSQPLAGAVRGLPTLFPWPVAMVERPSTEKVRLTVTPLYTMAASGSVWAESQWLKLWQTPRDQRSMLADLPVFDDGRDSRWPQGQATGESQSWVVAAAVERNEVGQKPQRLVAVGSNSWFMDPVTQQLSNLDGRSVAKNPGNLEFFESAVYWLAGQDELIAQSPGASAAPMIRAMDERDLARLRLAMVGGMPMVVLLLGAAYRFVRR